jgi:prepilin-type N-terminal cleavage/methylation domain-containing protein
MKAKQPSGFTLYELLTTLLIVGVVVTIGVPNVMELQRNTAMTGAANEIITGILAARAEAVKRQVPVVLCASPDPTAANPTCAPDGVGTNGGFIVWADENGNFDANGAPNLGDATDGNAAVDPGEAVLIQRDVPGGTINVWADSGYIAYAPSGFRRDVAATGLPSASWLLLCDDRNNRPASGQISSARAVRIDATGRGLVQQTQAEVANALAQIVMSGPGAGATCPFIP